MPIRIRGARANNLRNVDVTFEDGLTVVTGVSGSGKTSLIFDTLYHEADRRFQELFAVRPGERLAPTPVDEISGLGPAVAVGQNLLNRNPNSTLATAAGLHPFLRLLYTHFGQRHCPRCDTPLSLFSDDEIVDRLVTEAARRPFAVAAPLTRHAVGSHRTLLSLLADQFGAPTLRVDGQPYPVADLDPNAAHNIDVVLAHVAAPLTVHAARELVDRAAALGVDSLHLLFTPEPSQKEIRVPPNPCPQPLHTILARTPVCAECGAWFGELTPVHFHTACPRCNGDGCAECAHTGLHPLAAAVTWQSMRLPQFLARSVDDAAAVLAAVDLPAQAHRLQDEIQRRLAALVDVGLGYLALDRPAPTLSRGESQRVRLAVCLTSRLEDMLHVLDEPTVGLHPADVDRVLAAFRRLTGPVLYVEHDRIAAAAADHAVDIGPGAGTHGGHVVFSGAPADLWQADTATGRYFSLRDRVQTPAPRPLPPAFLTIRGASLRTLQHIDVPIPVQRLTVISGVSGSGKSTFARDVLVATLAEGKPVGCDGVDGPKLKPVWVDQDPIGKNSRSNPATYTKLADLLRNHFAAHTHLSASHFSFNRPEGACPVCEGMGAVEIKMRYLPSTWLPCAECEGARFSEEVRSCRVEIAGELLSIADVYNLNIEDVRDLLGRDTRLDRNTARNALSILDALCDVGLGYLSLGQPSPTLSGGEAQRIKLARTLGRRSLKDQLIVLDEPSTGLHPQDLTGLLVVLDRLVRNGATVVVVEHNADLIRAADWVIDLGPGAGPDGGRLIYAGPPRGLADAADSRTGEMLVAEASLQPRQATSTPPTSTSSQISIRGARANNLQNVDVDFAKGALTVVTGVSGSGKSSLVGDVLEAEARRRFLETLSLYERQNTREGPEAPVDAVAGLGVTVTISPARSVYNRRATVGSATELSQHLAVLLAAVGERSCVACGAAMVRGEAWTCPSCGASATLARPRHFLSSSYGAACTHCHGVGTLQEPNPAKLILHPEKPLCGGAMHSPGFFPKGYLCQPFNYGYDMVQALAASYDFDPATTPWNEMSEAAQQAFLYGTEEQLTITVQSRNGRTQTRRQRFPGFYGFVRDWDVGGTYTDTVPCPQCGGARLRPEYLAVRLGGFNMHELSDMPLAQVADVLAGVDVASARTDAALSSLRTARRRLHFLQQVGLGYLNLYRISATLSAGEAQRVRLAGLLGSQMTAFTVLLDEPTRGMHPSEVDALIAALHTLRDDGNTVIAVEHDPRFMAAADRLIDVGPGAGKLGGVIVAQGTPADVRAEDTDTARWLRGERRVWVPAARREPTGWITVRGARANNLRGETIRLPLGVLVGVCGVSGCGKSTLMVDTLGRALAPVKQTTSVAHVPVEPGAHDVIEGAPPRALALDQSRKGVGSPMSFLGLVRPLRKLFAQSEDAVTLGLDEAQLAASCSACKGRGYTSLDMGFLPDVHLPCEVCHGSGYAPEVWQVRVDGLALPQVGDLTLDEFAVRFAPWIEDLDALARPVQAAQAVGLGYLTLAQPGHALSGGEAQRLKVAYELSRRVAPGTLYLLDEPTT
ncbi:MAG: ATP-binding cassette domain-containing protein, partial [Caldilineaceae bacterium]|nr:ATP-binding cassette domain-containing protein [Caldilineaceae bacterium]